MEYVNILITLLKIITSIAAAELGIPSCQPLARQQQMRRGYTHQFHRGPKSDHAYRGTGSAYRNGTTGSYLTCAGMCLWDDACKSFNFCLDKKRCELNAAVFTNMTALLHIIGCQYFDEEYHEPDAEVECLSPEPLGLENRTIPDERMTASSDRDGRPASNGRLNNDNHWGTDSPAGSWIEVDLVDRTVVAGVITQGSITTHQWRVTRYKVAYKASSAYEHVTDDKGDIEVFVGNVDDAATPVTNMFYPSIIATVVRIEPVDWINGVSFRFELLGCRLN